MNRDVPTRSSEWTSTRNIISIRPKILGVDSKVDSKVIVPDSDLKSTVPSDEFICHPCFGAKLLEERDPASFLAKKR